MLKFLIQAILFSSLYVARGLFKYFFLLINLVPIILFLYFDFHSDELIYYYLVESIAYCLVQMIFIKLLWVPVKVVIAVMIIISMGMVMVSTVLIPNWNSLNEEPGRASFWSYTALVVCFYTIELFIARNEYLYWEEAVLKKNIIFKFSILLFIIITGNILSKVIQSDLSYIIMIALSKTVIELFSLNRIKE